MGLDPGHKVKHPNKITKESVEDVKLMVSIVDDLGGVATIRDITGWTGWNSPKVYGVMGAAEHLGYYFWHDPLSGPELGIIRRPERIPA
jgi:hypothetical protein